MAMKFWFGKKDSANEGTGNVSCDVLAMPEPEGEDKAPPASSLFGLAQVGAPVVEPKADLEAEAGKKSDLVQETGGTADGQVPQEGPGAGALATVRAEPKALLRPVQERGAGQVPPQLLKAVSSSEAAKPTLRSVGVPVRPSVPTPEADAEGKTQIQASGAAPVSPVAGAGNATAKTMTFGFRMKSKTSVVSSAPASAAAAAPAVASASAAAAPQGEKAEANVADASLVRPKIDQRALYYELMNGFYDVVLILDDQGHVVDSNTRVMTVLGYTREDMWDMPIDKVITGMTSQMFEHLRRNLAENHHVLIDARCFRQDGTAFAGEVGVSQLSLTRGGNLVFAIRNVDRRKTAMEELRKGQVAMQTSLAPTFVCDMDGFFQIVNQALLEAFGIPDEKQAKSVRFVDLLPDAARFFLRASCGEKLRETVSIGTPDGGSVKVDLVLSPIQTGQTVTAVSGSLLQQ